MTCPPRIGNYQIDSRLGGGGMAEVFQGKLVGAEGFSRPVAIKRVLPAFADQPQFSELFISEAQLCARLRHSNIVSVLDFHRDPEHGLFLVMELVEGKDLSQLLARGVVPTSVAIHLVAEVLRGLGHAHQLQPQEDGIRGIVHRDVSPQNVLLSWAGEVKLSDFGIAKSRAASQAAASIVIKGKPAYMSPEQAEGAALDGRSDLFAVGVMLWEMLTGRPLFHGGSTQEILAALFLLPIPSPRALRPELPDDVCAVTLKLLERDREGRYASAEAAIDALLHCRDAPRNGRAELAKVMEARFLSPARATTLQAMPGLHGKARRLHTTKSLITRRASTPTLWGLFVAALLSATAVTLGVTKLAAHRASPPSAAAARNAGKPPQQGPPAIAPSPSPSSAETAPGLASPGAPGDSKATARSLDAPASPPERQRPSKKRPALPKKVEPKPSGIIEVRF